MQQWLKQEKAQWQPCAAVLRAYAPLLLKTALLGMFLCHALFVAYGHTSPDGTNEGLYYYWNQRWALSIGRWMMPVLSAVGANVVMPAVFLAFNALCTALTVLLLADRPGLFRVDRELLQSINSIGDLTIATLPDHYPVEAGARLASMRIVPLVTQEKQILQAEALCAGRPLLALRPYGPRKTGVVITGSEIYTGRIQDKFEPVVRRKLEKFPGEILGVTICDDDLEGIVAAAREHLARGADFLIFTGGMSVDPDDLTPSAIRRLGAEIVSHGVPSQPGNMTLTAYLGEIPILGVPGAAISLPTTVFDVLLPQIFTGDRITREDLIRLGDGGLCQMCAQCRYPNCTFGRY